MPRPVRTLRIFLVLLVLLTAGIAALPSTPLLGSGPGAGVLAACGPATGPCGEQGQGMVAGDCQMSCLGSSLAVVAWAAAVAVPGAGRRWLLASARRPAGHTAALDPSPPRSRRLA